MAKTLKTLMAEATIKQNDLDTLLAKNADITADEVNTAKQLNSELTQIANDIKSFGDLDELKQNSSEVNKFLNEPARNVPYAAKTGTTYIDVTKKGIEIEQEGEGVLSNKEMALISTKEYNQAFRKLITHGERSLSATESRVVIEANSKTLAGSSDATGGYLVPLQMANTILSKDPAPTSLEAQVTTLTTSRDNIQVPIINYTTENCYTSGLRAAWVGENLVASEATSQVFGSANIPVYSCMINQPVSNSLAEDAAFDLMGFLTNKFREAVNLLTEYTIVAGTGSSQPTGMNLSTVISTTAAAEEYGKITAHTLGSTAITNTLLEAQPFALPPQYHPNAKWVMNSTTASQIFKLKDSAGRPFAGGGLYSDVSGTPLFPTLMGFPVVYSSFMDSVASGSAKIPTIFGDLKAYNLVKRVGLTIVPLKELTALSDQTTLLLRYRLGGCPVETYRLSAGRTTG